MTDAVEHGVDDPDEQKVADKVGLDVIDRDPDAQPELDGVDVKLPETEMLDVSDRDIVPLTHAVLVPEFELDTVEDCDVDVVPQDVGDAEGLPENEEDPVTESDAVSVIVTERD